MLSIHTAIDGIIAPLERPTPLGKNYKVGIMLTKTEQVLPKSKIFTKQVKSLATDQRIIAFDSKFDALKHGTIAIAIVDCRQRWTKVRRS